MGIGQVNNYYLRVDMSNSMLRSPYRCLCHPEKLCDSDNLLDDLLTHSQAQRLLHMICYPEAASSIDELDQKSMISRILEVTGKIIIISEIITVIISEPRIVDAAYVVARSPADVQAVQRQHARAVAVAGHGRQSGHRRVPTERPVRLYSEVGGLQKVGGSQQNQLDLVGRAADCQTIGRRTRASA